MKSARFRISLLLLTGWLVCHVQTGVAANEPLNILYNLQQEAPHLDTSIFSTKSTSQVFYFFLGATSALPTSSVSLSTAQIASLAIFFFWLEGWFFPGNYVEYKPARFTHQLPRLDLRKKPKPQSKPGRKGGGVSKRKHSTSLRKANAVTRGCPETALPESSQTSAIPEKYRALTSSVSSQGITYQDLSTKHKPDDFVSEWVWIVIGWIDNALKQAQGRYFPEYSLDDVLAYTDPALPAIVRGTLKAILFVEDQDTGEPGSEFFSDRHVALSIGWMDYMFLHYNCPLSWREWLVSRPVFTKGSLLQSESEDLMTFDISRKGVRSIAQKVQLSEKMLNSMSQPGVFRSTGLWIIIQEFYSDQLYCQDASSFSTIFPADLIFADTVSSVLFEIFSAKSELTKKELYLMEYWLDLAVERLQAQTRTSLEWRKLMTQIPNKPKYLVEQPSASKAVQPPQSSEATNVLISDSRVTHQNAFEKSTENNQALLFQLYEFDTEENGDEEDDSGSDYEFDGEGYFTKSRAK